MQQPIIKHAFNHSVLTAFYVVLVALFMSHTKELFGNGPDNALIPMAMLLLLIFSATLCGSLVFGRPVMWYLDGKKNEALKLLGYTALFLFIMMVAIFVVLYFVNN